MTRLNKADLRFLWALCKLYWEFQAILDPPNAQARENAQALKGNYSPTTITIEVS